MSNLNDNLKIKTLRKSRDGFTLVESLVAISILSLAILGTFTAVQASIQSSTAAKNQITAFYLIQEGMEYIKNIRDTNSIRSSITPSINWLARLSAVSTDPCYFGKTCVIDSPAGTATNPAGCTGSFNSCPNLRQETSTGLYGYTSAWTLTNFKREIQFQNMNTITNDEVLVTISVSWMSGSLPKSLRMTQSLFNRKI